MTTTPAPDAALPSPAPEGATASTSESFDVEAAKAAMAKLAALEAKIADERKADREAKRKAQEDAEKAGELAKALEAAKARLAELEGAEPLAAKWRAYEAEEAKRLDAEAATLPDAVRDLYQSAGDIDARRKVIAAFKATSSTQAPAKGNPPSMGAPAPVSAVDIEAAIADKSGQRLAEIKKRDPNAVTAWFKNALGGKSAANPSLGAGRFAPKAPNA